MNNNSTQINQDFAQINDDLDKRKGEKPIPDNVKKMLTDLQLLELNQLERFGWQIKFVRRPLFQEIVVVICSPDSSEIAILEKDGTVNKDSEIKFRDE